MKILAAFLVVLGASYVAKQRLLSEWERSDRTGTNSLTHSSASTLIALSVPWDVTVNPWTNERSALVAPETKVFLMPVALGVAYAAFRTM